MNWPTSSEILSAAWIDVSLLSKVVLGLQIFWVLAGVFPKIRHRLRRVSWFVALIVGPPLLWILATTSVALLVSFVSMTHHFALDYFFRWLIRLPIIIGTTAVLQALLALQYAEKPLRAFPVFGVVVALLAILGDIIFVLSAFTPL